jgi:hypothetical protein
MDISAKLNDVPLALLAYRINRHQETISGYTRNALQVALDQGDLLRIAKARVGNRKWKFWREENCPKVTERTDALHRRLAAHRHRLEQELAINPDLGVREAVSLISTPKVPKPKVSENTAVIDPKVPVAENTSSATLIETATQVAAQPIPIKTLRAPTYPMTDATRAAVIGLARAALSVSRRPVSAPNMESIQSLLEQIITAAKVVTQPTQSPVLDTTLFNKAMGIGVAA